MDTRQKFEWDVKGRCPQSAFKDGKFNPEYVEWLENEYIPFELKGLIKKLETQLAETQANLQDMIIERDSLLTETSKLEFQLQGRGEG